MSDALHFAALFQGRTDAVGAVWGESIRLDHARHSWTALWDGHLHKTEDTWSLGIYPMIEDDELAQAWTARLDRPCPPYFVKWGCSDIDDGYEASLPLARNMKKTAELLGADLWVERTKGKGYHCWLFADEWVPAEVMRRAFLAIHQIAGVRPTEVNPKQVDAAHLKAGLGNYVNLPYAASAPEGKRVMIDPTEDRALHLDWFLATVRTTPFDVLFSIGSLYKPPPPKATVRIEEPSAAAEELSPKLGGLAYKIWKEGPLDGRDRSTTLARLAHLMAESESRHGTLTPGEGMVLLRDADQRWGKFFDRADGEEQLQSMIESAAWK